MAQYAELQSHLNRVRWAWKRAAALQGLAAVVMEGLGMFLLFALVDYIYSLQQPTRVAFLTITGAALAFLFGRHVLRPLLRVIPDDQVALYIEERQQETEGALLSATAFGKGDDRSSSALYNFIVENIVCAAVTRAGSIQLSKLLDVRKLRKYAIAAVILLLFFGLSAFKFSSFFGARATRLLMPWQVTDEDRRAMGTLLDGEPKIVFEVAITPGERVLRGSAIGVKAKLSRTPREDVCIKFRTKGTSEFRQLKMEEIEELNSFAIRLPDVNDDLEFMIQSGREVSKTNYAVTVYDKLEIKGYELTLTPPAYTRQNTVVETSQAADITALIGTKVKFRALANTPLERGELKFDNGKELVLVGESGERAAVGEFTIERDAAYTVKLRSADGQDSEPGIAFMIKALTDEPPTLSVVAPASDMACHPAAEVDFTVEVQEDVGIGSVEMVYNFPSGADAPHRVPLGVEDTGPGERELSVILPMAELQPRVTAGDTLFYHMIVKDLKGQEAVSDIYMLKVRPFEIAGAYPSGGTHARAHAPPLDLMLFIAAIWNVHIQKDHIEKTDYDQRCDSLWEKMTDGGKPRQFKKPKIQLLPPEKAALVKQGDEYVARGIENLRKHDTGAALAELRQGLALYERAGTGLDWKDKMPTREIGEGVVDGKPFDPMKDALGFVKMDIPTPEYPAPPYEMKLPEYRRAIKSEDAKELREEAQKLQKKEQQLIDEARKLAATKEEDKPKQTQDEKKEDPQLAQKPEEKKDQKTTDNRDQKPAENKGQKPEATNDRKAQGKTDQERDEKPLERNERKVDPDAQGQNSAEREERKKTLEKQQEQLANDARKLANKLAAKLQTPDKDAKDVLGHLRKSAKEMEEATKQIKEDNLQKAAARGEQAKEELVKAAEKLEVSQYDSLEKAVEAAEERALQIADEQKKIQQAANRVVEEAGKRAAKTEKKNEPKLTPQELQKMQGLAKLQVENQKNAENLETYVNEVAKWAEDARKKDAADELKKAAKIMKQDELAATMITAAVNMGQQELEDAKANQEKLDKTLTKVTTTLQNANSALAATNEQKLKRALNETKELRAKAEKLAPKPEQKPDDKQTGEKKPDDKQTGEKKSDERKPDDKQTAEKKNDEQKGLTPEEQAKLKAELYRDTAKLARRLEQDKLLDPKLQAQIQNEVKEERAFHGMFKEDQRPRLASYMSSIRAVSSHLEGKLESVLKAKRLSAAQREQTPIQYREMVNAYYERLAKE